MPQLVFIDGVNINTKLQLASGVQLYNQKGSITTEDGEIPQVEFRRESGQFIIENLHPELLGMAINGESLLFGLLKHGDLILLGDSMLLYHEEQEQPIVSEASTDTFESQIDERIKPYQDTSSVLASFSQVMKSEQHKQLMLAYRINNLISSACELDDLLQQVLELLVEGLHADRGFFFLRDENTKKLRLHFRLPHSKEKGQNWSNTILKEVLRRKESLLYVYNKEEDMLAGKSIVSASISSVLAVPLTLSKKQLDQKDKILGILQLDTFTSSFRLFTENELNFVNIIGTQVAAAISQVRHFQQRKRYSESLVKLSRCNQFLSSHLSKEKILKETINSACKLLGCTKASVVLYDRQFQKLAIACAIGMDKKEWKTFKVSSTESLCAWVLQRQEPLLVEDFTRQSLPFPNFTPKEKYQSNSFLIVPIPSGPNSFRSSSGNQSLLGVICATDKMGGGPFVAHEQELLNIIATQTGIALANAELYEKATIDALTRLYVRRYFFQKLEELIAQSHHQQHPLSLLMVDLDFFKRQNDTYGHQVGDIILRELGVLLRSSIRDQDVPARYGGEEFAVILYQATPKDSQLIAERIRQLVARFPFNQKQGPPIQMTVSMGLTCLTQEDNVDSLIGRADRNLYEAKTGGRNRVVFR